MSKYDDVYSFDDKPKRKRDQDPTTWADAWRALGLFTGVMIVISVISFVLQTLLMGDRLTQYYELSGLTLDNDFGSFFSNLLDISTNPLMAIVIIVFSAVIVIIALLIIYGIFHLIATKFFGGEGTLRGLIVRANPCTIGVYTVYTIIGLIASNMLIYAISERFAGTNPFATAATMQEYQAMVAGYNIVNLLAFILWVVWSVFMGRVIANNYQTETKQGCLSVFVSNIIFGVVYCGVIFVVAGFFISTMDFSQIAID